MLSRGWRSWLAAGVIGLCAGPASAAPGAAADEPLAGLLRAGAEAMKSQRWDACVDSLTAAAALHDSPATWGDLGLCEEQAGKFALAHGHLSRALESAPAGDAGDPWKKYQAALQRVRPRVALLLVTTDPTSARVIIDGRPVGQADGRTIAVEPGTHTVAARLDGHQDEAVTRAVRAGDMPNIHLWLKPRPRAPVQVQPPMHPSVSRLFEPAWNPRGVLVTLAYAGAATAVVSGATAIGFEAHYQSLKGALDAKGFRPDACADLKPPATAADCADILSRAGARATSANVLIGSLVTFGVLSGAAGLAMLLDRGPGGPKVTATVSTDGGGIFVLGSF